ncbi:3-oxoacyl-ACP synthase III [Desulfolithobacter dissulfuricans]|uniref:3-oxoacyl-ACP synthase III n=1 Tax=Desulfolithobacter dissulfuricans TaxID=2795293 RepID=A0A915XJC0_9BACT|nr:3-oxoacyl-ACP synthase III [Desulfolithobacter dissulfuricans]BCO10135.1 3-oxoacyl-ACP synthase III [Desulfolithobacter dissulfuricans]
MNCTISYNNVCLHDFGYALPPNVVTSAALEERLGPVYRRLKLPAGRLELMSGIRSRRFWNPGTRPSQGAALAGEKALAAAAVERQEIGCLVFTSVSRDMMEPATASFVHRSLALPSSCQLFDLSNACLGFLNGMVMVANMIELGQIRAGLVVASETAEDLVESTINHLLSDQDLTRRSIKPAFASLTIGSGAVAMVLGDRRLVDTGHYLVGGAIRANTDHNDLCQGGQNSEQGVLMSTNSELLLEKGVETAAGCWEDFLAQLEWEPDTIDRFFCHQVGRAHAQLLFGRLGLDPAKNFETLPVLGNVGSVSAPITMARGVEEGILSAGQRAALLGIGSGINSLMLGVQW